MMNRDDKKKEDGSVLVECIAALVILMILALAFSKTIILSGNIMAKSEQTKMHMFDNELRAAKQFIPDAAKEIELILELDEGRQIRLPAREIVYVSQKSRLYLVLDSFFLKEKEYGNEDTILE